MFTMTKIHRSMGHFGSLFLTITLPEEEKNEETTDGISRLASNRLGWLCCVRNVGTVFTVLDKR
jgi:hypothetical protein|tara:strand:- start:268 stop:459 length:192 start_codon:yes stop_codon:yes gene_type:complete